ncbi:Myotubularin protein 9 [Fasciola hepatica]|uniref:Myotubularin protein 9 n=1 Tax=Fasciola hepatica TaxID=6192 RepID=A0A4E0R1P3_FASHE|nr:Myotubularin protein 9 [Fasciola hepatica]
MELASLIRVNNINGARLCAPNFTFVSKKLALTNHFILLVSETEDFYMLHKSIDAVRLLDAVAERRYSASGQQGFTLVLYTKTFCVYELTVPTMSEARALHQSLEALCNVDDWSLHYPFFYKPSFPVSADQSIILSLSDYHKNALNTGRWRVSHVNKGFAICATYPEETVVPAEITDSMLTEIGAFRRGARFPVLAYYHGPRQTALLLSSEPYTTQPGFLSSGPAVLSVGSSSSGPIKTSSPVHANTTGSALSTAAALSAPSLVSMTRCRADEQLLAAVLPDRFRGAILDLRDQTTVRKSSSGQIVSIESEQNYPQWRRVCRPMELSTQVYHVFQKFIEVCTSTRRSVRNANSSFAALQSASFSDSLSVIAAAALGPSGPSSSSSNPLTSLGAGQFTREVDNSIATDRTVLTFEPAPFQAALESDTAVSVEASNPSNRLSATGINVTGTHSAGNMRRIAAWLSLVREALAAAVAGATALDARDTFAQQQLQQEQCLLAQKCKNQRGQCLNTTSCQSAPIREEAKLRGSFVLVHSTRGLDRAIVVASLVRVILDPSSRTITGLQNLIEHLWIRLGHPFSDRLRSASCAPRTFTELAPIFTLFLDCVWQLWRQYPTCFEFTEELLCFLVNHAYCSEFGTFLGNSMKERAQLNTAEMTVSLWSYLNQPMLRAYFKNPLYAGGDSVESYACWPCLAPQALAVWRELYQRQVISDPQTLWNRPRRITRLMVDNFHAECNKVSQLKKILRGLQEECVAAGLLPSQ